AWRLLRPGSATPGALGRVWRIALTYLCVLVGSVFFRAPSVEAAMAMLAGMVGLHGAGPGVPLPATWLEGLPDLLRVAAQPSEWHATAACVRQVLWLVALYAIVWGLPNTKQIFVRFHPALDPVQPGRPAWLRWAPNAPWALAVGALATVALLSLGGSREFLYFQF
ncbi:MAG: hypothetical protein J0H99_13885, partial [Rhodospirillales bacterium]|nr:hypothetical protein [Rhodospirillales bacterium]